MAIDRAVRNPDSVPDTPIVLKDAHREAAAEAVVLPKTSLCGSRVVRDAIHA